MAGYIGTDQQIALQEIAERAFDWMAATPGACNSGRSLGTDDPDRLGWDIILKFLERDKVFAFRLIRSAQVDGITKTLSEHGYRLDLWDVFLANRADSHEKVSAIVADGLPNGFCETPLLESGEHPETRKIQAFMVANGISPFSGAMLAGEFGQVTTVVVNDEKGEVAATAHGYLPHNNFSQYHKSAWGGLVAVSPNHRGKKLGKYVNAKMVSNCFSLLGAETVYELVTESNIPSRRMVEASGLKLSPSLKCGGATAGANRFTR
ncbi:MAG: GNAT family N-acetyltransferase [Sneathiella sp.]|nr:MAG: GNAT family N-acetyltransferase [Sneathiella sp.]